MKAQFSRRIGCKCGCDPYRVESGRGVDGSPGSATPGYVTGMLRIPQ